MASIIPDQYLSNLDRQIWLETVSVGNGVATLQKLAVFLAGDRIIVATTMHHNFFRPYLGIGKRTPAEAAGITIQGDDKWITFIHNAALSAA